MDITHITRIRHTCKAYDPSRKIPTDGVEQMRTLLRYALSSVNLQLRHYFFVSSDDGKARVAKSASEGHFFQIDPVVSPIV